MYNNNFVQKEKSTKGGVWSRVVLAAILLGMSMSSQAGLIGLDLEDSPDLYSNFINVDYLYNATSSTGTLTAVGTAAELTNIAGQPALAITGITVFSLEAFISNAGVLTGGTLNIGGIITSLGFNSNSLLTGNLTMLGFADDVLADGDTLEFLFNVTGGDAASLYGGLGGVILAMSGFDGSWAADFSSGSYAAVADTGVPVPEPTSMWLLGSGLIGLAGFSRRKQKK